MARQSLITMLSKAEKSPKEAKAAAELVTSIRTIVSKPSQEGGTMGAGLFSTKEVKGLDVVKSLEKANSSFARATEARAKQATDAKLAEEELTALEKRGDINPAILADAREALRLNPGAAGTGLLTDCAKLTTEQANNVALLIGVTGKVPASQVKMAVASEIAKYRKVSVAQAEKDVETLQCKCNYGNFGVSACAI